MSVSRFRKWWNEYVQSNPRRAAAVGIGAIAVLFLVTVGLAAAVLNTDVPTTGIEVEPSNSASAEPSGSARPSVRPSSLPSATASPSATPAPGAPTPSMRSSPAMSGTWTSTGSLDTPRGYHTATLLTDGRVLVAGGINEAGSAGNDKLASAELYDPASGSWTATGSMTRAHWGHTATLLRDGRVLVVDSTSAELYDPGTGTWTATAGPVHVPFVAAAALVGDGTVLIAGGLPGSMERFTPAEVYDPRSGSWAAVASLHVGRFALTLTSLHDGSVLAAGGVRPGQDPLTEMAAERYDPATRSWTLTGDMLELRMGHAATLLPDGSVLATGGILVRGAYAYNTDPTDTAAELYDPDTNTWRAAGSLLEVRSTHTATLLSGGTVLVIGYGVVAPPELFDPATGSSAATALMAQPRSNLHTATLLPDGTVLVTGGYGTGCCYLASAELFHPISDPGSSLTERRLWWM